MRKDILNKNFKGILFTYEGDLKLTNLLTYTMLSCLSFVVDIYLTENPVYYPVLFFNQSFC